MRSKKQIIAALGILIVGAWILLGQRAYRPQSTMEEAALTEYGHAEESSQVSRESLSAVAPHSDVTSSIGTEFTSMPAVTQAPNDSLGLTAATDTSPNNLLVITSSVDLSTSDLTKGLIGELSTPPGRFAPDVLADPLQFSNIRIYKNNEIGVFSGQANVKNLGTTFLNNLVLSWKILDSAGQVLDQGQVTWPNLAPAETATIQFVGQAVFVDTWQRVQFVYLQ